MFLGIRRKIACNAIQGYREDFFKMKRDHSW